MDAWVILAGYAAGTALSWRSLAMSALISLEEDASISGDDRAMAASFGILAALFWPASLPIRFAWRLIKGAKILETPKERLAAQQRELQQLRDQAREFGLPLPEVDARGKRGDAS